MSGSGRNGPLRVVVLFEASNPSEGALDALAGFCASSVVELRGLLVEDPELVRLAELPVARQVSLTTGLESMLDSESLAREMTVRAERLRASFERGRGKLRLPGSFGVVREGADREVAGAAQSADLLLLHRGRLHRRLRRWPGGGLGRLVAARRTVVVVAERWHTGHAVLAWHDGTEPADRALTTAARLARAERLTLVIALPAGRSLEHLTAAAELLLTEMRDHTRLISVPTADGIVPGPATWRSLAQREGARALVVPAGHEEIDEEALEALLDQLDCSLVVVG